MDRFLSAMDSLPRMKFKFRMFAVDSDFSFVTPGHQTLFSIQGGLSNGAGLLVRPDQHILAMLEPYDPPEHIHHLIVEHLGLS